MRPQRRRPEPARSCMAGAALKYGAVLRILARSRHRTLALGALMVNERSRDVRRGETGPVTMFGPDFPFPFDDWIAHPAGLGSIPAGRAWRGGRGRRRWHLRAGRRVRADEARPQAGGLRGLADGRAVALAGVRGSRRRGRGAGRDAVPGVVNVLLPLRRHAGPADPAVPQPADRGGRQHGHRP